jgi:hypothetical protein
MLEHGPIRQSQHLRPTFGVLSIGIRSLVTYGFYGVAGGVRTLGHWNHNAETPSQEAAKLQKIPSLRSSNTSFKVSCWDSIYSALSTPIPGLMGHLTARGEAHTARLALTYALLDGTTKIRAEHLRAALAIWDYSAASARFIWGDALGNPVADEILKALRAALTD